MNNKNNKMAFLLMILQSVNRSVSFWGGRKLVEQQSELGVEMLKGIEDKRAAGSRWF
jgi:hypothetical protein